MFPLPIALPTLAFIEDIWWVWECVLNTSFFDELALFKNLFKLDHAKNFIQKQARGLSSKAVGTEVSHLSAKAVSATLTSVAAI